MSASQETKKDHRLPSVSDADIAHEIDFSCESLGTLKIAEATITEGCFREMFTNACKNCKISKGCLQDSMHLLSWGSISSNGYLGRCLGSSSNVLNFGNSFGSNVFLAGADDKILSLEEGEVIDAIWSRNPCASSSGISSDFGVQNSKAAQPAVLPATLTFNQPMSLEENAQPSKRDLQHNHHTDGPPVKRSSSSEKQSEKDNKKLEEAVVLNKNPDQKEVIDDRRVKRSTCCKKWSQEEDDRLKKAVELYKSPNWKKIADYVGTRNNKMCSQRWRHALRPEVRNVNKGTWTKKEDDKLKQILSKEDERNERVWDKAAEAMDFTRNAIQCRERWINFLDPSLRFEPWTPEEDACLLRLQAESGNKWKQFTSEPLLHGRSAERLRRRYTMLKKRR